MSYPVYFCSHYCGVPIVLHEYEKRNSIPFDQKSYLSSTSRTIQTNAEAKIIYDICFRLSLPQ